MVFVTFRYNRQTMMTSSRVFGRKVAKRFTCLVKMMYFVRVQGFILCAKCNANKRRHEALSARARERKNRESCNEFSN